MAQNEMTSERKNAIIEIIKWYWDTVGRGEHKLHSADFLFLYDLWDNSLEFYNTDVQTRLNQIRDIYIENHPNKSKTFKL